jgi:hypothetical protein
MFSDVITTMIGYFTAPSAAKFAYRVYPERHTLGDGRIVTPLIFCFQKAGVGPAFGFD